MTELTLKIADGIVGQKDWTKAIEAARKFFAGVMAIAMGTHDPLAPEDALKAKYGARWKYFCAGEGEYDRLKGILHKNQRVVGELDELTKGGDYLALTFRFEVPHGGYKTFHAFYKKEETIDGGGAQWDS
jgi:hypothetical protein